MSARLAEVSALIESYPPPFIFINDPISSAASAKALQQIYVDASTINPSIRYAHLNAVKSFTPRLFFDSALNTLANWTPKWDNKCLNWGHNDGNRYNDTFDSFLHGLAALDASLPSSSDSEPYRYILSIERAERLKDNLPDILVPLTRLAELSRLDFCVIFISESRWEDMRPSLGASHDPYYIDVAIPANSHVQERLAALFQEACARQRETTDDIFDDCTFSPFNDVFTPLFADFAFYVCNVCKPFTSDPDEIEYVAFARWPGFVKPLLDEYQRQLEAYQAIRVTIDDDAMAVDQDPPALGPPPEDVRMRLYQLFRPSIQDGFPALYSRTQDASTWALRNVPPDNLLDLPYSEAKRLLSPISPATQQANLEHLPRMSKFVLIASYVASTNPQRTDLRMFGRGLDEKKRKRRVNKPAAASGAGSKVGAHLNGPSTFPLDRLIAILGALLEENDADVRPSNPKYTIPGEHTDVEISRVSMYASITELTKMKILHRTSQADRIDGPPTYKSGVSFEIAQILARELDVQLQDLLHDPM